MNQQIKDLEERLDKIRQELESLKQPDYLNKWVVTVTESIYFVTKLEKEKNSFCGYGFGAGSRGWKEGESFHIPAIKRLATKEEVEEMLKNEAIKRGFKKGVRFDCLMGWTEDKKSKWLDKENKDDLYFHFYITQNELWLYGVNYFDLCAFKEGAWANIINKKKMTLKEIEQELGYEIELI